jgi:hypothetical protein
MIYVLPPIEVSSRWWLGRPGFGRHGRPLSGLHRVKQHVTRVLTLWFHVTAVSRNKNLSRCPVDNCSPFVLKCRPT